MVGFIEFYDECIYYDGDLDDIVLYIAAVWFGFKFFSFVDVWRQW